MPRTSPDYNNQIDPKLPTAIKPLLYAFDEYQTYDLVGWAYCGVDLPMPDNFPTLDTHQFLSGSYAAPKLKCILFDRFTPDNYPWADGYAMAFYNLINKWTGSSFIQKQGSLPSGINIYYQWIMPSTWSILLPGYDDVVILSFLVKEKDDTAIIANATFITYSKRHIILKCIAGQSQFVTLDFSDMLTCSLVVSANTAAAKNYVEGQLSVDAYLYQNLQNLIQFIDDSISLYLNGKKGTTSLDCQILTSQTFTKDTQIRTLHGTDYWSEDVYIDPGLPRVQPVVQTAKVPPGFTSYAFIAANNNFWANSTPLVDGGNYPLFDNVKNCYLVKPSGVTGDMYQSFMNTDEPAIKYEGNLSLDYFMATDANGNTYTDGFWEVKTSGPPSSLQCQYDYVFSQWEKVETYQRWRFASSVTTFNYPFWSPYSVANRAFNTEESRNVIPSTTTQVNKTVTSAITQYLVVVRSSNGICSYDDNTPAFNLRPSMGASGLGGKVTWGWIATLRTTTNYLWKGVANQITDAQMIDKIDDVYYA